MFTKILRRANIIFNIALILFIIQSLFTTEIYLYSVDLEHYLNIVIRVLFAIAIITYLKPISIFYKGLCKYFDDKNE